MLRPRSAQCLITAGALFLAFWALANSNKRFAVDIRVIDAQSEQSLLNEAAAAIDQQTLAARIEELNAMGLRGGGQKAPRSGAGSPAEGGAPDDLPPLPAPAPSPAPAPPAPAPGPASPLALPSPERMLTCEYSSNRPSSRPGAPCMPPAKVWPYKTRTAWKTELGERIMRAVTPMPHVTEEVCDGWDMYGDQTWCVKAFADKNVRGFSFGIEGRDMYSEYLSNRYQIPMKLFDCFQDPDESPALAGTVENGTNSCGLDNGEICYGAIYWAYQVCLGPKAGEIGGRTYDTLHNHLAGIGDLGAHVKIDVEGSEWTVLEQLVADPEDQAKVKTLDMEIHFGFEAPSEMAVVKGKGLKSRLEREIDILEGLLQNFYVTGTTLEVYRMGWTPELDCPKQQCDEPVVTLTGGFTPRMFAISFVNKRIVDPSGQYAATDAAYLTALRAASGRPPLTVPLQRPPSAVASAAAPATAPAPAPAPPAPAAPAPAPQQAQGGVPPAEPPKVELGPPVAKFGFYMHVFDTPAAVIYQRRQIKKYFPDSPVYIMSDGGYRFDKLCKAEDCTFKLCPPANDRWHPWPFLRRLYDATIALNVQYVIMLEPDNTIHGPITREPSADAGGLPVRDRKFRLREWTEKQAQKRKPGFKWTDRMMSAGLAGGAYFKTEAILDAFSDEVVANFDWNHLGLRGSKEAYSSDFAMQYLLAARGWTMEPWDDAAQMDRDKDTPITGAKDAAFRHYCSCYPGGKPTYQLNPTAEDRQFYDYALGKHHVDNPTCQMCYYVKEYEKRWGSRECTNRYDFEWSEKLLARQFADGKYPHIR